jgi:hypothetical protein
MNKKNIPHILISFIISTFALGFFGGYFLSNRHNNRQYGIELESVRSEQRRIEAAYNRLGDNYSRERALNNRIRDIITDSSSLLESNDQSISGFKRQISSLREKGQELQDVFDGVGSGVGNGAGDEVRESDMRGFGRKFSALRYKTDVGSFISGWL